MTKKKNPLNKKNSTGLVDFKKPKQRVGKIKTQPVNATNTSFKSQAINVEAQGAFEDKGEIITNRNLTLKDLLTQLKHYNPNVRHGATGGIRELWHKFPEYMLGYLGTVMSAIMPLMLDTESSVRNSSLHVLQTIFDIVNEETITPFFPLIGVFSSSAMTHIYEGIRLSALEIVNECLERYPHQTFGLISEFNILQNLLGMLTSVESVNSKSVHLMTAPSKITTAHNRVLILNNILSLLEVGLGKEKPVFTKITTVNYTKPLCFFELNSNVARPVSRTDLFTLEGYEPFYYSIMNVLFEFWVEFLPQLTSSTISSATVTFTNSLTRLLPVLRTMRLLCVHELKLLQKEDASTAPRRFREMLNNFQKNFNKYFFVYFPFGRDAITSIDNKTGQHLRIMNLLFCDIVLLMVDPTVEDIYTSYPWLQEVIDYVSQCISEWSNFGNTIMVSDFFDLLTSVSRTIIDDLGVNLQQRFLGDLIQLWNSTGTGSQGELVLTQFFYELVQKNKKILWVTPMVKEEVAENISGILLDFIIQIPRKLKKFSSQHPPDSIEILLRIVHDALCCCPDPENMESYKKVCQEFQKEWIGFFVGKTAKAPSQNIAFASLSETNQRFCLDLLYYLRPVSPTLMQGIRSATIGCEIVDQHPFLMEITNDTNIVTCWASM